MFTHNNVDETENEHTDILSTEDNKQESTNAGVHKETLNKLCDEPGVHEQDPDNNAGINFIHNHLPPMHPWGFAPKVCPHPGAFAS